MFTYPITSTLIWMCSFGFTSSKNSIIAFGRGTDFDKGKVYCTSKALFVQENPPSSKSYHSLPDSENIVDKSSKVQLAILLWLKITNVLHYGS